MQMQADSACKRLRALSRENRAACLMECHHGRRAGGVDRHTGAPQVEDVGDAVRCDARSITGSDRRVNSSEIVGQPVGIIRAGDSNKDAALAAAKNGWLNPGVFQRLPAHFK